MSVEAIDSLHLWLTAQPSGFDPEAPEYRPTSSIEQTIAMGCASGLVFLITSNPIIYNECRIKGCDMIANQLQ